MDDGRMISRKFYSMGSVYSVVCKIARGEGTKGISRDSQIIACRWLGVRTITQSIAKQWLRWARHRNPRDRRFVTSGGVPCCPYRFPRLPGSRRVAEVEVEQRPEKTERVEKKHERKNPVQLEMFGEE